MTTTLTAATGRILAKHLHSFPTLPPLSGDDTERQFALEQAAYEKGIALYNRPGRHGQVKSLDKLAPGRHMLESIIRRLEERIKAAQAEAKVSRTRRGRPANWHEAIKILPALTLAVIAAEIALECTVPEVGKDGAYATGHAVTGLAIRIGNRAHDVFNFEQWLATERENAREEARQEGVPKEQVERHVKRHVIALLGSDPSKMTPEVWNNWKRTLKPGAPKTEDALQLGRKLIDLLLLDGRFEALKVVTGSGKQTRERWEFFLSLDASKALFDRTERAASAMPSLLPMVVPPTPWCYRDGQEIGGYMTLRQDMVRADFCEHTRALHEPVSRHDLAALNAIQATPWRVNVAVLDVMQASYDACAEWLKLCRAEDYFPPKMKEAEKAEAAMHPAAGLIAKAIQAARSATGERSIRTHLIADKLIVAELFRDEAAIYYPHHRDYRGRCYPIPNKGPSPQGDDASRALLTFADAVPVGADGLAWLKWWAATCYGKKLDKAPEAERVAWADDNRALIQRTARNPLAESDWTTAETPWQFLAACFELDAAWRLDDPTQYASSLPICFDATCSGLQHLACLAGDRDLAVLVNLTKGERQDVYGRVAKAVNDQVSADAADVGSAGHTQAVLWLGKVTRALCKQPVMTTPYGSLETGICRQLRDKLRKDGVKLGCNSWEQESKAIGYLAGVICDVREAEMQRAMLVMRWLQDTAETLAKAGKPFTWTTPTGSRVQQSKLETETRRVRSAGHVVVLRKTLKNLKPGKQRSASAPNFVHSLDGCLVYLTVNAFRAEGMKHIAAIHDCFGARAAEAGVLARVLRDQFARLYAEDNLATLATELRAAHPDVVISDPPTRGDFDPGEVRGSAHAFS